MMRKSTLFAVAVAAGVVVGSTGCKKKEQPQMPSLPANYDPMMNNTPVDENNTSSGNNSVEMPPTVGVPEGPKAGRSPMRLLTRYEYDNTVSDVFGVVSNEAESFPPENVADGFENNAWVHKVNPSGLRYYLEASERLSQRVWDTPPEALQVCVGEAPDAQECKDGITAFLPRVFRRPVEADEVALFHSLYDRTRDREDEREAFESTVQLMLQSPQFLYRVELYERSPVALDPVDGGMTSDDYELVGPYEMASRLSYMFWASAPDAELLAAAEAGDLNTPDKLKIQIERLMGDDRVRDTVATFHRQWLGLDRMNSVVKDPTLFPDWDDELRADLRISLNEFINYAYWEEGTLHALLNSQKVFMTAGLAQLYGLEQPAGAGGVWEIEMPASERAGLLTQPALLAMLSYPNQSSPINRAVFVREKILCQHLPPPPADMEITAPDPDPSLTTRETFAIHTEDPTCAGCHTLIDPLGFGFEGYDALGRYRETENGKEVDVSGELVAAPDASLNGEFTGAVDLASRLGDSDYVAQCMSEQWFTFIMGRHSDESDEPSIEAINEAFADSGFQFGSLLEAIVLSDSFRYRKKRAVADAEARAEEAAAMMAAQEEGQ